MIDGPDSAAAADTVCPNCDTRHRGHYCPHCGQDAHIKVPTVRKYLHELAEKYFGVEGRLPLTLRQLFLHPGAMTVDYLEGRRQRYISPLRLYLAISLLFFVGLMQVPGISVRIGGMGVEINTEAMAESRIEAHTGFASVDRKVAAFAGLAPEARNRVLRDGMIRNAPRAMLLLVPLFAALLMLLYRSRYYGEHLLTALHFHSFAFLLLLPGLVPWPQGLHDAVNNLINLVLAVYLFLMLRRIYGGGKLATGLRLVVILAAYVLALAGAALAGVVIALGR
ncbi:MAG: DUF3667 domain-containing protein [Nevskia sp.]